MSILKKTKKTIVPEQDTDQEKIGKETADNNNGKKSKTKKLANYIPTPFPSTSPVEEKTPIKSDLEQNVVSKSKKIKSPKKDELVITTSKKSKSKELETMDEDIVKQSKSTIEVTKTKKSKSKNSVKEPEKIDIDDSNTKEPIEITKTKKSKSKNSVKEPEKIDIDDSNTKEYIEVAKTKKTKEPKKDNVKKPKNKEEKKDSECKSDLPTEKKTKKMKKNQKTDFYLNVLVDKFSNQAVVLRSSNPHLILYRSKYYPHMNLLEETLVNYLKPKPNVVLSFKDIDWEPNEKNEEDEAHSSDSEDSEDKKDKKEDIPPTPYLTFLLQEKDHVKTDHKPEYPIKLKWDIPIKKLEDPEALKHHFTKRLITLFEHPSFEPFDFQEEYYQHWLKHIAPNVFSTKLDIHEAYMLHWIMGAGKSECSLLPWSRNYVKQVYIVCVNTMIPPWIKFIMSMSQPSNSTTRFTVLGLTEFSNLVKDDEHFLKDQIVIFDEVHCLRNVTTSMKQDIDALRKARSLMNLTGTPIVNGWANLHGLGLVMMYSFQKHEIDLINTPLSDQTPDKLVKILEIVKNIFTNRIHYANPSKSTDKFAIVDIELKYVQMSWKQVVDYLVHQQQSFQIGTIDIGSSRRNSYHTAQLRYSNSGVDDKDSSKFASIVKDTITEGSEKRQIIYSNFLGNGIKPIYQSLKKEGLKVAFAIGDSSEVEREDAFKKYNTNEVNILAISKIGGTGLTFRNTSVLRLTDSFQNDAIESQAIGRISRIGAHTMIKGQPRPRVKVVKYISTFPTTYTPDQSVTLCDYFYKKYCSEQWGSKQKLFEVPEEKFIDLLIEKIQQELNNETIDQSLLRTNAEKQKISVHPLLEEMEKLGTFA
jgi:hypothetical protein